MAESDAARNAYAQDILNMQFFNSAAMMVAAGDATGPLTNARVANLARLEPNARARSVDDRDATLAPVTGVSSADVDLVTVERELIQADVRVSVLDTIEAAAGGNIEMRTNEALAGVMGEHLDTAAFGKLTASTYAAVAGAVSTDPYAPVDNALDFGNNATIGRAFPFTPGGSAAQRKAAWLGMEDVYKLLWVKKAVGPVYNVGPGSIARAVGVVPISIGSWMRYVLAESFDQGDGQPGSANRQAVQDLGIFGTDAYVGRAWGIDWVTVHGLPTASAGADHFGYVIPVGTGAFQLAAFTPLISNSRFVDGNTDGALANTRYAYQRWGASVAKPGHVVRIEFRGA